MTDNRNSGSVVELIGNSTIYIRNPLYTFSTNFNGREIVARENGPVINRLGHRHITVTIPDDISEILKNDGCNIKCTKSGVHFIDLSFGRQISRWIEKNNKDEQWYVNNITVIFAKPYGLITDLAFFDKGTIRKITEFNKEVPR